jgi:hypothetical protein
MKTLKFLLLIATMALLNVHAEEWRKVAFVGDAKVKSATGLVEIVANSGQKTLRAGDKAEAGQTIRVWRGAELVLWIENTQSFVRAAGPTLVRLIDDKAEFQRSSVESEDKNVFEVRAVRGGGKALHNGRWVAVEPGMILADGAKVRPFRDSIIDLYNPATRSAMRVTDHSKPTTLVANQDTTSVLLTAQTR